MPWWLWLIFGLLAGGGLVAGIVLWFLSRIELWG
jgi:hypothetical protein